MITKKIVGAVALFAATLISCVAPETQVENSAYVDPTIGNVVPYLVPTYPTIQRPNQMMRMFPVKADYISDQLKGLPMLVPMHRKPGIMQIKVANGEANEINWAAPMIVEHALEVYHPWLYSTYLRDENIKASFTPAVKGAIYKFDFVAEGTHSLRIAGGKDSSITLMNDGQIKLIEQIDYTTKGEGATTRSMKVYLYGVFTDANGQAIAAQSSKKQGNSLVVSFSQASVELRYAVSYIDSKQAKSNFDHEKLGSTSFDALALSAKQSWDKVLNQINVEGGTDAQKRTFYTSLYRTYERMVNINENGRYFSAYDNKVHTSDRDFYVDDWVWDTYRAQHPLRTILTPSMQEDMLDSYVQMYKQSGFLPTFPQVHGNHLCMNSYHTSSLFLDAYRKGLRNYDVEAAYAGIKKNLTECTFIPWRQHAKRTKLDDFFHKEGYFPALALGEKESEAQVDDFEKRQAVAVSLGVSYDFWTMTEFAKELGKQEDVSKYSRYSGDYKKLWDEKQQLFIPKDSKDQFVKINPKSSGGKGYREYYDENNGWTYAWDVPHDIAGLTQLLGGKRAAEKRLDQLFREPLGMSKAEFVWDGANSTGMVGQFSMGNEPSFHIPYLYNYFGAPWKTQQKTRFLLDVWFKDNIFGMPGDEDGGGMTAFVVMSAMGIYPVTPGEPVYAITSPIFEKTSIALENGKTFTVEAKGASHKNQYIQSATLNGEVLNTPFITHEQIMNGANLLLVMGELPNKEWGR